MTTQADKGYVACSLDSGRGGIPMDALVEGGAGVDRTRGGVRRPRIGLPVTARV